MSITHHMHRGNYGRLTVEGLSCLPLFGEAGSAALHKQSADNFEQAGVLGANEQITNARLPRIDAIRSFLTIALLVTSIVVPALGAIVVPLWVAHTAITFIIDLYKIYNGQSSVLPVAGKTAIKAVIIGLAVGGVIVASAAPFMAIAFEGCALINHLLTCLSSGKVNPADTLQLGYLQAQVAVQGIGKARPAAHEPPENEDVRSVINVIETSDNLLPPKVLSFTTLITNPQLLKIAIEYYKLPHDARKALRYDSQAVSVARVLMDCKNEDSLRRLKNSRELVAFAKAVVAAGKNDANIPSAPCQDVIAILQGRP